VTFRWEKGDLLLVDNLRFGHGRLPFRGERKILAALIKDL
jgi:alpha-ketoglutarate-dependent taurine dioxygenase